MIDLLGLRNPSRIWGVPTKSLVRVYQGAELDGLLRPGSSVSRVEIRPATGSDPLRIEKVRRANRDWLEPWEATVPPGSDQIPPSWSEYARRMARSMRDGTGLLMTVDVDGEVAGCVSLGAIERGSMSQAVLGYWIGQHWAGQGITSLAVASVIDTVIQQLNLHRIEVNVRPENQPSLGVCRRLGLREEGYKPRLMSIAGQWADHVGFAIDEHDLRRQSMIRALEASRRDDSYSPV